MSTASRIAGGIAGTVTGVVIALATAAGMMPQSAQAQTYCQWSAEPTRKVVIFGDNIQAWRLNLRTLSPITMDVPNTSGRTWVKITVPKGFAEDDIQDVQAKVNGTWRNCGTA